MTVTGVRPSGADVKVVGVTTSGGTVTAVTSDNNLGTYAIGTVDSGFAWLNLANTVTLTGTTRVKSVQLRVQNGQGTAEAAYQTGWVRLRDPITGAVAGQTSMVRQSTTVSQQRGPIVYSGAPSSTGGTPWTQTLLDRVTLEIAWHTSPAGYYLRVHELYADVDINTQPTVGTLVVTGATTTTRPNVSWVFTDADSDPQTRYQVKIFSAAQYGAAGFSADGSTSTWDSGQLYGSTDSVDVETDLMNAVTYKAYVRAAQDWPGPEGDVWWSAWVASSSFTIAIIPPPTPSLTATLDPTLPGYRVLLSVLAPINLLTLNQSSLETDTAGWTALANCTITRSTSYAAHGSASLQMSSTAAGTMTAETSTRPTVLAGGAYFAKATVRSAVSARTVRVGIRWYDQAGALIGSTVFGTGATTATGSDTVPVVSATAPASALTASVVLEVQSTGAGAEIHRWDKIGLWVGGDQTWHVGGDQPNTTVTLERMLKVSSLRAAPVNWAHPQLAGGGSLTRGTDGFYARLSSLLRSAPADLPPPGGVANSGARMIVWHPLIGASNGLDFGLNNSTTDDPAPPYLMPAVPGRAQTLSVYLKGSSAVNARITVVPVDAANAQVGTGTEVTSSTVALSTSAWGRYTTAITPPAGTAYLRGLVELPSSSVDLDVHVTGIQLELGSAASALVPGTGAYLPAWEPVRAIDTTAPTSPGERYVAYDHEAPPGDPVLYRARTVNGGLASPPCAPIAVLLDLPASPLLKDPFQPENAIVVFRYPDSIARTEDAQIYQPLGRDRDPVKVVTWRGGDDGTLHFETVGRTEIWRLRQLMNSTRPLLLQHHDGGQMYLLLDPANIEEMTSGPTPFFSVTAGYRECGRPI